MWPTIQRQETVYTRKQYATNLIEQKPVTKKNLFKNFMKNAKSYSENVQAIKGEDQPWHKNGFPIHGHSQHVTTNETSPN